GCPHGLEDAYLIAGGGGAINAALRCAPLEDPVAGAAAIVSFRDIRAEKEAQRQAMQCARLVSIGQLAAGVAHEINTPAQYIANNMAFLDDEMEKLLKLIRAGRASETAADDDVDFLLEEVPKAVAESRQGVEQIARIVRSVKEFAHPGAAAVGPADINHAVETALTVSHNIWKNVLTVERDLQHDLPLVICNIGEINQVFLNLIANAADAVEALNRGESGRLRVSTRADGDMMEARFEDDGPGVPQDMQDRIFDPFFTTKPVGKGTGQGLAICRNIVAVKHGGSLSLENAPHGGAAFIVRLPFNPPDDSRFANGSAHR
ncbi:MAG TPA: ATP-binding protein, partial [Azospirillaceae bacterium]|nr:ATP-binding protein [Azospirillaceae bacterium]